MASPKTKRSGAGPQKAAVKPIKKLLLIRNHQGLHARPAALFVQVANRFKSSIRVRKGNRQVDGKSIMGLLTLAAGRGSVIEVRIEGPDADAALHALQQIISHADTPVVVTLVKHRPHASKQA